MKKILSFIAVFAILLKLIPISVSAVCSHVWNPTYCEAAHPHAYFHTCRLCGLKQYTGGYATKAHGNGAWGSGTCPSCGTHTFAGQSCTTGGACSCGASTPALGHGWNPTYSEAAHPHAYYHTCYRCGILQYTGGYATKNHGSGAYGSGTCPQCGTHNYCTPFCDAAHPHRNYLRCGCGDIQYIEPATYTTKPHGDGSPGSFTCPSCGEHTFVGATCTTGGGLLMRSNRESRRPYRRYKVSILTSSFGLQRMQRLSSNSACLPSYSFNTSALRSMRFRISYMDKYSKLLIIASALENTNLLLRRNQRITHRMPGWMDYDHMGQQPPS
jgi:hypothetical protein